AHRDAYLTQIRADASIYALVEAIGVMAIAGIAWWASHDIANGADVIAEVALVVAFNEYVNKFFLPVRDFSNQYAVMQGAMAATERIVGVLENDEPDCPEVAAAYDAPIEPRGLVSFRDVEFGSRTGDLVLKGVSLDV